MPLSPVVLHPGTKTVVTTSLSPVSALVPAVAPLLVDPRPAPSGPSSLVLDRVHPTVSPATSLSVDSVAQSSIAAWLDTRASLDRPVVDTFLDRIQLALPEPILSVPIVQRCRPVLAADFSPRRSPRLACHPKATCCAVRITQRVLMSKLGILDAHDSFTDSELQRYKAKFDHPLRLVDIEALAALFNLGIAVEAGAA